MQFSYNMLLCHTCGSPLPANGTACVRRKCRPAALRRVTLISMEKDTDPTMADLSNKAIRTITRVPLFPEVVTGAIRPVKKEAWIEDTKDSERLLSQKVAVCIAQGYSLVRKEPGQAMLRRTLPAGSASQKGGYEMLNLMIDASGKVREAILNG